jgi:two-component system, cell cycle sensor histidine kinase and response regulator CckA
MCRQQSQTVTETHWDWGIEEPIGGGAETILFVEDEAFVRDVTREVLRSAGYTVLVADSAAEALTAFVENRCKVDLLLTDVILPGETGLALAAKLRRQNPALHVLFVTGYADQVDAQGPDDGEYLAKPFSTGVLLRKVRALLDRCPTWSKAPAALKHASGSA